jgi:hypothetical protein
MEIFGQIRGVLAALAPQLRGDDVLSRFVRATGLGEKVPSHEAGMPSFKSSLEMACGIRLLPWLPESNRERWREALRHEVAKFIASDMEFGGPRDADHRPSGSGAGTATNRMADMVDGSWRQWIAELGVRNLGMRIETGRLNAAWDDSFESGSMVPSTAEKLSLEVAVYMEFRALHAAYNAVALAPNPRMMKRLKEVVDWHVDNTQPDNSTQEPWALAAFAALDPTGTFAEQQLHDARTRIEVVGVDRSLVALALLADAVVTAETMAGG